MDVLGPQMESVNVVEPAIVGLRRHSSLNAKPPCLLAPYSTMPGAPARLVGVCDGDSEVSSRTLVRSKARHLAAAVERVNRQGIVLQIVPRAYDDGHARAGHARLVIDQRAVPTIHRHIGDGVVWPGGQRAIVMPRSRSLARPISASYVTIQPVSLRGAPFATKQSPLCSAEICFATLAMTGLSSYLLTSGMLVHDESKGDRKVALRYELTEPCLSIGASI